MVLEFHLGGTGNELNVFFKVKSYFYLLLSAEPTNPLCLLDDPSIFC